MFTDSGILEACKMLKAELKLLLEEYWFDNQYLKEKEKEVESINKIIHSNKATNYILDTKKYEEAEMSKLLEKKKHIEGLFQNLQQPYRTIMYMKYISFLSFDQIADRMNYSTKRIYQLHSEAINTLLQTINASNRKISNN